MPHARMLDYNGFTIEAQRGIRPGQLAYTLHGCSAPAISSGAFLASHPCSSGFVFLRSLLSGRSHPLVCRRNAPRMRPFLCPQKPIEHLSPSPSQVVLPTAPIAESGGRETSPTLSRARGKSGSRRRPISDKTRRSPPRGSSAVRSSSRTSISTVLESSATSLSRCASPASLKKAW